MLLTYAKYALLTLAITLVAAVATPHAAAANTCVVVDQTENVCVRVEGYAYGSCDTTGSEGNAVALTRQNWTSYSGVYAGSGCGQFSYEDEEFFYRTQSRSVGAQVDVVPGVSAGAGWYTHEYEHTWGSGVECSMGAHALGIVVSSPCFAGPAPRVPVVLP